MCNLYATLVIAFYVYTLISTPTLFPVYRIHVSCQYYTQRFGYVFIRDLEIGKYLSFLLIEQKIYLFDKI